MTKSVFRSGSGWLFASLVAAFFLSLSVPASAVTVSGLYSVDVPVSGTSSGELRRGYAEGLGQVLVRVSGTREVLALEGVESILEQAESLLLSYQVIREAGQARLQMSFGAVGVNRALASVQAPVWGANRPLTLSWVAVEERGDRELLTRQSADNQWAQLLLAEAATRGLPVAFPPDDFAGDRTLLSDLWGQFVGRIQQASGTLPHDALALVRISRAGDQWRAGWVFEGMGMNDGEQSLSAATPELLATAVIDRWTERFASRYAVTAGEAGESPKVDIVLEGVVSLADYGQVTSALQSLTPVVSVGASRVRGERLTAEVVFSGELDQLQEYLALDPRFVAIEAPEEPLAENRIPSADGGAAEPGVADNSTAPEDGSGAADAPGQEGSAEGQTPFSYQPMMAADETDTEQAFESLYEVLYYRWQPAPGASGDNRN